MQKLNAIAGNRKDADGKRWYEVHTLGPYNVFDFPLWIKWESGHRAFFRSKAEMVVSEPDWIQAKWWRQPWGDSGKYRILERDEKFIPQEEIEGEWSGFVEFLNDGTCFDSLDKAKARIAQAIKRISPAEEIIHPYP